MSEHRFVITDRLWQRIAPLLPGKATDRGVTAGDNRLFLEAVKLSCGRCAPAPPGQIYPLASESGTASSAASAPGPAAVCFRGYSRPSGAILIWSTCSSTAPHCPGLPGPGSPESRWGKRGTQRQSIGRSRGGLTTKIVALVDALGNLLRFLLLPGQSHQSKATRAKGWHP